MIYDNEYKESLDITKHFTDFSNLVSLVLVAKCGDDGGSNKFQMFIYRQKFPSLQRLYLGGNVFEHELQISYAEFKYNFPSLLYLRVGRLHINFALRILDEYYQLRSFSAKLYCNTQTNTITPFNTPLPSLKVLELRGDADFGNEFGTQFLERFLPCCPNIDTFMLDVHCHDVWGRLLQEDWWSHTLVSNTKLVRIALNLKWMTRLHFHNWSAEVQRFRESLLFTRLNTNVKSDFDSEFLRHMIVTISIKNYSQVNQLNYWILTKPVKSDRILPKPIGSYWTLCCIL